MSGTPLPKNSIVNSVKLYFFPSLVTILAMLIWRDVSELRSDVKSLLAQSNVDKTEIQHLKKDVDILNQRVFKTPGSTVSFKANTFADGINSSDIVYFDRYFKHEEEFDINKHLPYKTT
jgi:hypothetical protein